MFDHNRKENPQKILEIGKVSEETGGLGIPHNEGPASSEMSGD